MSKMYDLDDHYPLEWFKAKHTAGLREGKYLVARAMPGETEYRMAVSHWRNERWFADAGHTQLLDFVPTVYGRAPVDPPWPRPEERYAPQAERRMSSLRVYGGKLRDFQQQVANAEKEVARLAQEEAAHMLSMGYAYRPDLSVHDERVYTKE